MEVSKEVSKYNAATKVASAKQSCNVLPSAEAISGPSPTVKGQASVRIKKKEIGLKFVDLVSLCNSVNAHLLIKMYILL